MSAHVHVVVLLLALEEAIVSMRPLGRVRTSYAPWLKLGWLELSKVSRVIARHLMSADMLWLHVRTSHELVRGLLMLATHQVKIILRESTTLWHSAVRQER